VEEGGRGKVVVNITARVAVDVLSTGIMETRRSGACRQTTDYGKGLRWKQPAVLKKYLLGFKQATADQRAFTLDSLRLYQLCKNGGERKVQGSDHKMTLTLNLGDGACKDVLLRLFVLDRLQHVLDDGFRKGSLLVLLGLLLITDPRIQNGLELGSQANLLLEDKRFGLEFGGFLDEYMSTLVHLAGSDCVNLGESKETLSDRNDILHLLNRVNSVFDSLSVFGASTVEDSLNFGNLSFSPVTVGLTDGLEHNLHVSMVVSPIPRQLKTCLGDKAEKQEETDGDHSLLVHHIEFLGDGGGNQTRTEDDSTGLGDQVGGRRELVDDLGSLLSWWLSGHSPSTQQKIRVS